MLTASFPPGRLDWMAWIAIIPLLISIEDERPFNAFRLGMIAGLSHYLTLIYWVLFVMNAYGGIDLFTGSAILLLFSLYLSLYPATFSLLVRLVRDSRFVVILAACIWVSLEYLRTILITGFPWCLLGYSQFNRLTLIQVSDVTGVYGVSFIIAAVNALIYRIVFTRSHARGRSGLVMESSIILALFMICAAHGIYTLRETGNDKGRETLTTSVIQGNIDQSVKWDPIFREATMERYISLTKSTFQNHPDLILWPESAAPFFFQDNTELSEEIRNLARESSAWLIFGCPAYEEQGIDITYYNRVCMISPGGSLAAHYDKVHLVPFGEYVPLRRFIPFVDRLVISEGEFSPGRESGLLNMDGIKAGALICYEAIFPGPARTEVKKDARFFVNVTSDAWFGMTSAPWQHLCMCVFRSVENRRPFVRAANTGFSAFIDRYGRITAISGLFMEEVLNGEVRTDCKDMTFYTRHGDIFIYLAVIICLIKFLHELCYHLIKK